jgi:hypothetical protein
MCTGRWQQLPVAFDRWMMSAINGNCSEVRNVKFMQPLYAALLTSPES